MSAGGPEDWVEVSEGEARRFAQSHQEFERDSFFAIEPVLISLNDFSDGKVWPESMQMKSIGKKHWIRRKHLSI